VEAFDLILSSVIKNHDRLCHPAKGKMGWERLPFGKPRSSTR
jgi:hypothetical protein